MLESIKSEKLFDWNANETPIDSPETRTPFRGFVETEMNLKKACTDNTKTVPIKQKVHKPYTGRQKFPTRMKICSIVPKNHFGPIPGIPVGTCWEKRIQVSEAGVHRPPVAGIHGRAKEGAYSIVFSGTYAEDKDFGEEFFYSGCGGGVTDTKKLISGQICDQTLTCHNKALAVSCNAPVNDQVGADAEDWQAGKPVRVIRTHKLKIHSKYAPDEGNRYDGIYKVVKYFPEIGQCGLLIWRFLLRRDDPEPAPWTDEGKQVIAEKNLQMIRAKKTDYVQKVNKKNKNICAFPDEDPLLKIIREVSQETSDVQDEETRSVSDWLPTKSKSKKLRAQQPPKKIAKTKLEKSLNHKSKPKFKKKRIPPSKEKSDKCIGFQFPDEATCRKMMNLATNTGSDNVEPVSNPLATDELLESPRKRNRKQKFTEFLITDPCEYDSSQFFDVENGQNKYMNAQIDCFISPTSELKETGENDYNQGEAVEIERSVSVWQANTTPKRLGKRNCDPQSNKSHDATCQPIESATKSSIKIASVMSLNCKNVSADCKTLRNKSRNARRNRITEAVDPLKVQNQIDLTIDEDEPYILPMQVEKFIDNDVLNKTIWEYCRKKIPESEAEFLNAVRIMFTCRYCDQLAANPVTTSCDHNVCLKCISNHFSKEIFSCPDCHNNLGSSSKIKENRNLASALENLFPGYNLRY